MKLIKFSFLAMMMALIGGCGPTTDITGTWKAPAAVQKDFNDIFVAALIQDLALRQSLENEFAARLRQTGVEAKASMDHLRLGFYDQPKPDKDQLLQTIRRENSDGIMTITVLDIEKEERYVPGTFWGPRFAPWPAFGYYGNFYGYFDYWHNMAWSPGYYATDKRYVLETNLYDAETLELVWSAQSKTVNPANMQSFAEGYAEVLSQELREEGIIS